MGLLNKIFGKSIIEQKKQLPQGNTPEHAVIVRFNYGFEGLHALHELEVILEEVIEKNGVGEYDGHEIAIDYSDGILYMYGPDAENLLNNVKPILKETPFMKGSVATLRFGPPEDSVKEITIRL